MEATRSVVESALTEGAIGYRKFSVLKGKRLFAIPVSYTHLGERCNEKAASVTGQQEG